MSNLIKYFLLIILLPIIYADPSLPLSLDDYLSPSCNYNYYCDDFETKESCPQDCSQSIQQQNNINQQKQYNNLEEEKRTKVIIRDDSNLLRQTTFVIGTIIFIISVYFWVHDRSKIEHKSINKKQVKTSYNLEQKHTPTSSLPNKPARSRRWGN